MRVIDELNENQKNTRKKRGNQKNTREKLYKHQPHSIGVLLLDKDFK